MAGGHIFLSSWSALVHSEEEVRLSPVVLRSGPYGSTSTRMSRTSGRTSTWTETTGRPSSGWPVSLANNLGFSARELRRIGEIVTHNRTLLREAWRGYFGT